MLNCVIVGQGFRASVFLSRKSPLYVSGQHENLPLGYFLPNYRGSIGGAAELGLRSAH